MTVGGVDGSVYPSVDGVGVASLLAVAAATGTLVVWTTPGGFLDIFDLVSRAGIADPVATTTAGGF